MAFIDRQILMTSDGMTILSGIKEILLTTDAIYPMCTNSSFREAVLNPIVTDIHKIVLLYPDERERMDVSSYVIDNSISYSGEYKNGQTRSVSFTVNNKDGFWNPSPVKGVVWAGTKVKLYSGILCDDIVYWISKGVFVMKNPSYDEDERTASLQFADKFATLDGTLGGKLQTDYKINAGTPIYQAISTLLQLDTGNGVKFDLKPIVFPSKHAGVVTPYTLEVTHSNSIGDIILELANIISCDAFYNEEGYLTLQPADDLLDVANKSVLWRFGDKCLSRTSTDYNTDFEGVINIVCVVGANINGAIVKHISTNDNAKSPSNIYMMPIKFEYISDSNISTYELCEVRADYELQKKSVVAMTYNFECLYMPFIEANSVVLYTDAEKGIYNQRLFVTSVSTSGSRVNMTCTNVEDLPF